MNRNDLLSRIRDAKLRAAVENALTVSTRFTARRQAVDRDVRLTDSGRLDALADELAKSYGPEFRLAKQPIADARAAIEKRRAAIKLPSTANDPAGVLRQMEIRTYLSNLEPGARARLLLESDDTRFLDAAIDAPAELSGVPRDLYDELTNKRLRELHGSEMADLDRAETELAEAEAAVAVAQADMKAAFDPKSDGRRFGEIMSKPATPWLLNLGTDVVSVKFEPDGTPFYPVATEEERRTGQFFPNMEAYKAQAA